MTRLADLIPGDVVSNVVGTATFITHTDHPLFLGFRLVIWWLHDGRWSHDALDIYQDVGVVRPAHDGDRRARLREALTPGARA